MMLLRGISTVFGADSGSDPAVVDCHERRHGSPSLSA